MGKLDGKVAVVIGVGSRLGRASASSLGKHGASLFVADQQELEANQAAASVRALGRAAESVVVELTSEESIAAVVAAAVREFGAIDVLHNNTAATLDTLRRDCCIDGMDSEVWDQIIGLSLRPTMLACKYAIPEMVKAGGGAIINTTWPDGLATTPIRPASGCVHAAGDALTQFIASAYGSQGIRCNAVAPGIPLTGGGVDFAIASKLDGVLPVGAEVHGEMIAFLASCESAFMTGQTLRLGRVDQDTQ